MKAIFKGWNLWSVATWGLFALALVCVEAVRAQDIGTETVLHSFSGTFNDGSEPTGLVQLSDGSLYGVTVGSVDQSASVSTDNVFFKINTTGTYTPLANGCGTAGCTSGAPTGRDAGSSLIDGGDGKLYAIASNGSFGQFYQLTPQGAFTALYTFPSYYTGNVDFPGGSQLILGSDGNFYGTAYGGPSYGTIFRLTPGGVFTQLYAFSKLSSGLPQVNSDGAYLNAPLVEGTDGNFYGVALYGGVNGSGTIFKFTPSGVFSVLYAFSADSDFDLSTSHNADGAVPGAGLVQGSDGNFYGTTQFGGANGVGTIFRITPAGAFTKLHDFGATPQPSIAISATPSSITAGQSATLNWAFTGTNDFYEGGTPVSKLTLGTDGNLYGVSGSPLAGPFGGEAGGGQYGKGIAFQITPGGTFTILYSFGSSAQDGAFPYASLIQGSDGNFYGTTYTGGADPALSGEFGGTIFKLAVGPAPASTPPCTASGAWSGSEPASGSFIAAPTTAGTYTYTLTCTSSTNQVVSQNVILTVTAAVTPPTVTIAANPSSVVLGNSSTLTWSSTNATSCTASGAWSGTQATSGTLAESPAAAGSDVYTLSCTGSGGTTSASATLTVSAVTPPPPAAPTVTLAANPPAITLGQSTTLSWSSTNATSCTASGAWNGAEPTGGSMSESPGAAGSSTYTLSCSGPGGSASASATVTVAAATPAAPTLSLTAQPAAITLGQSTTLSWTSANATSCTASGAWSGQQDTAGEQTQTPDAAGAPVYTLSCSGPGGNVVSAATVTVSPQVTTTELTGKAGGGGFGFGSLLGLGLFALLRQRALRRRFGYLLMMFCLPAFAQDLDFDIGKTYLGLRGGIATYGVNGSDVNSSLSASGAAGSVSSIDHRKGAGVLYAGVPFYHGLSLELGYADLGIYHVSLSTRSANVGQVAADTVGQLKPAGRGITLGLGGPFDLGRWFAVEPHLGALIYQSRQEVFTPSGTYSKGDYGVGLDAGVALLAHPLRPVYAGVGFECFDTGGGCNVRLVSLQMEVHFGH